DDGPAIQAAGAILDYLSETQRGSLDHIDRLLPYRRQTRLELDHATRRSLEICQTARGGRPEGSLLAVIGRAVDAMGARRLGEWLSARLAEVAAIEERLESVAELRADAALAAELREVLHGMYDVERLLARVTTGRATPRDLAFIAATLRLLPKIKAKLAG